jgi:hypothetical protein
VVNFVKVLGYDVLEMTNEEEPRSEKDQPADLSEFTHGAQSVKATCGCLAVALLLAVVVYTARHFLFR